MSPQRDYALVTAAYWAFTLTDGAGRMLVLLHFHALGYSPVALAFLFVLYELFGIITNLFGGIIATRKGLKLTLTGGIALQVVALLMLAFVQPAWPTRVSVAYVMSTQALSGIAKDLTKMSAKSAVKQLVPAGASSTLFRWVALLTGSKNALKGAGFFLGGALLTHLGFRMALFAMAASLSLAWLATATLVPEAMGKPKTKAKLVGLFSTNSAVNRLAVARFFLFGARDIWFVVGVPVFLAAQLGWGFERVGSFLALWVIGYGFVQSVAPSLLRPVFGDPAPHGRVAFVLAVALMVVTACTPLALAMGENVAAVILSGLGAFGAIFALNSSVHSYLILAYSDGDKVALNVGFYYMANAGGRLVGTLLSGLLYQAMGLRGCLWASTAFVAATGLVSLGLPPRDAAPRSR